MTLTVLRTVGKVFYKMFLYLHSAYVTVKVRMGVMDFWEEDQRWSAILNTTYQGFMLLTWLITCMLTLITWPRLCLPDFSISHGFLETSYCTAHT